MSIIIEFFTAPDDAAAAGIVDRGPTGAFDSLADAAPTRLAEVGELWIAERAEDGEVFDPEMVGGLMGDLAGLARTARERGHSLYCWMA